jgi:glutamine synthetase
MALPQIDQEIDALHKAWEQQDIRYVVFELADMSGMPRSKIVPLSQWQQYALNGLRMIGVMVTVDSGSNLVPETHYSEERNYGDSILKADLATASTVPWMPHTARVICDPHWPDGTPLQAAPRYVLRRVLRQLEEAGYRALIALEYEFYLLRDAASQQPAFEGLHIFHNARNTASPVTARIMDALPQMGIEPLTCNCEYGPGQYEITYAPRIGLLAGDQGFTFKQAVKAIAHEQGYHATFMTRVFPDQSASGAHIHLSLLNERGENAFLDTGDKHGLSELACYFIQGMLKHAPATLALMAPTPNCFQRFVPHSFAPLNLSWGLDDRTALVRAKSSGDAGTHLENRLPSALSNPYLAIAAAIAAGLQGIRDAERPHEPIHEPAGESDMFEPLPASLGEALSALEQDEAIRAALGEEFTDIFIKAKQQELVRQQEHVQQQVQAAEREWQLHEYLADY